MSRLERRLVSRLQQRDERAFRELVRKYQQPVYSFVLRMLGNREEAEDLAQEVFVTIFKSIGGFRGDSKLSTWIYRIATNHCHNRHKYLSRRRHQATQSFEHTSERALTGPSGQGLALQANPARPDQILEGKRVEHTLQGAIARLDEGQRLLVILRDVQGLSYQEIGEIAGLAEGTVKSRLHRARMALKESLKGVI
jgi:RNA polymerase sigma-70 factor (ECF subfamily)